MILRPRLLAGLALSVMAAACSDNGAPSADAPAGRAAKPEARAEAPATGRAEAPVMGQAAQINDARFSPPAPDAPAPAGSTTGGGSKPAPDPMLIKAQVLLARADFSPGEVDGLTGSNFRHAVAAYAEANGLKSDGELTQEVWDKLGGGGGGLVAETYTLADADVAGPWSPETHDDLAKAKGLPALGFTHATELLGEKFHMSEDLLKALNPGVDFARAGERITVVQVGNVGAPAVDHIEVDKAHAQVRTYDADGRLTAMFPATVGSVDRPSPSGVHKVVGVSHDPDYVYNPAKLTWGPRKLGKFIVKPGPNNPVGVVWIDLNAPSYGLHGTPEPHTIGKTGSHGCVRMTNWDAVLLSGAVKPGVKVTFLNSRKA